MTITYEAIEFETVSEAIQHTDASGRGVAIIGSTSNRTTSYCSARRTALDSLRYGPVRCLNCNGRALTRSVVG
jgi:hypothetical protein